MQLEGSTCCANQLIMWSEKNKDLRLTHHVAHTELHDVFERNKTQANDVT